MRKVLYIWGYILVELNRFRGNLSICGNFRMLILKFTMMKKKNHFW